MYRKSTHIFYSDTVDGVEWTFKSPGICQLSHFEDPLRDPISANANSLRECMKLCKHNCKYVSYAIPNCYIADNCDLMHSSSSYKTFGKSKYYVISICMAV